MATTLDRGVSNGERAAELDTGAQQGGESWLLAALAESEPGTYSLRKGDTLWSLAKRYGTSADAIINANKKKLTTIRPGQTLKVPGQGNTLHCVRGKNEALGRKADTLYSIAAEYGVDDWREIVAVNLPVGLSLHIPGLEAKRDEPKKTAEPSVGPKTKDVGAPTPSAHDNETKAKGPSVRFEMPKAPIKTGRVSVNGKQFSYAIKVTGRVTATADSNVIMSQEQLMVSARTAFTESFSSSLQIGIGPDGVPALTSTLVSAMGKGSLTFKAPSFIIDHRPPATELAFGGYDWLAELGLRLELTPLFEPKAPTPSLQPVPIPSPGGQGYWTAASLIIASMFAAEVGAVALGAIMEGPSPIMKLLALGLSVGVVMKIMWNWGDIDAQARAAA